MPIAMLRLQRCRDAGIDILHAHDRARMASSALPPRRRDLHPSRRKESACSPGTLTPAAAASTVTSLPTSSLLHMCAGAAFAGAVEGERRLGQALDRSRVQLEAARLMHRLHECLNTDATTKTSFSPMQSRLLSNAAPAMMCLRGLVQIGRLIHHHRRIARPGRDDAFAVLARSLHHRRPAGHAEQRDLRMLEDLFRLLRCSAPTIVVSALRHAALRARSRG